MALANVGLGARPSGHRVLVIDWDLEAPGLHRYFEPFLEDKTLQRSTGVIDFVLDFATAAVSGDGAKDPLWYEPYSNVLAHALSIEWDFANGGLIDFVPAGRQMPAMRRASTRSTGATFTRSGVWSAAREIEAEAAIPLRLV